MSDLLFRRDWSKLDADLKKGADQLGFRTNIALLESEIDPAVLDEKIGIAQAKVEELKYEVEIDAEEKEVTEKEKAAKQLASKQAELKTLEKKKEQSGLLVNLLAEIKRRAKTTDELSRMKGHWGKELELREEELKAVAGLATEFGWETLHSRCIAAELTGGTADKIVFEHGVEDPDCDSCVSWDRRILPDLDGDEGLQDNACKMRASGMIQLSYSVEDEKKSEEICLHLEAEGKMRLASRTTNQKFYFNVPEVKAPKQYRELSDTNRSTLRTYFAIQEEDWSSLRQFFLQRECRRIEKFKRMFVQYDADHGFGGLDLEEFKEMMNSVMVAMNLSVPLREEALKTMYNDINESDTFNGTKMMNSADKDNISFEKLIDWLQKPAGQLFSIEMDRQSKILDWA